MNTKIFGKIILTFLSLTLTGCASTQKAATYSPDKSHALNLMNAAGIGSTLKDTKLPQDTVNTLMKSDVADLGFALSGFGAPLPGLNGLDTAGLNLLATVLAPEDAAARNSIFGWMPENSVKGKDPEQAFFNELETAFELGLKAEGYTFVKFSDGKKKIVTYVFYNPLKGCVLEKSAKSHKDLCGVTVAVWGQEKGVAPSFVNPGNYQSYYFSSYGHNFTRFSFIGAAKDDFTQFEILKSVSKNMPDWAFMYLAPKQISLNAQSRNPVPLVLDQGEPLYFVISN